MTSTFAIQRSPIESSESYEELRDGQPPTEDLVDSLTSLGHDYASVRDGYRPGSEWHIRDIEYISDRTVKARLQQEIYHSRLPHLRRGATSLLAEHPPQYQFALFIARLAISMIHGLSYAGVVLGGFWLYQAFGSQHVAFYMPAFLLIAFSIVINLASAKILHSPELAKLKGATTSKGEHFAVVNR